MAKFKIGDLVQMTSDTYAMNRDARSYVGEVVGLSRIPKNVRVKRDGLKTVELWHEDAWELRAADQQDAGELKDQNHGR